MRSLCLRYLSGYLSGRHIVPLVAAASLLTGCGGSGSVSGDPDVIGDGASAPPVDPSRQVPDIGATGPEPSPPPIDVDERIPTPDPAPAPIDPVRALLSLPTPATLDSFSILPVSDVAVVPDDPAFRMRPPPLVPVESPTGRAVLTRLPSASPDPVSGLPRLHDYSRRQAWNANESLLHIGNRLLDARDFREIPRRVPLSSAWAWSTVDPATMYGVRFVGDVANEFGRYDVLDDAFTLVHRFDGERLCTLGRGEGRPDRMNRRVAIHCLDPAGAGTLYVLDIASGTVRGRRDVGGDLNWASITPSGERVLAEYDAGDDRRLVRYDAELGAETLLTRDVEHGDVGVDVDGDEVFVMVDSTRVYGVRLHDGALVEMPPGAILSTIDFGHVSCLSRSSRCTVSANAGGWLADIDLRLNRTDDGLRFPARFALRGAHRSSAGDYFAQPKASLSPSGRQLVFSTDWQGQSVAEDVVTAPLAAEVSWRRCLTDRRAPGCPAVGP